MIKVDIDRAKKFLDLIKSHFRQPACICPRYVVRCTQRPPCEKFRVGEVV